MVFTLPPDNYNIDINGKKIPDYDVINNTDFINSLNKDPDGEERIKFELLDIVDLPLIVILRNIANTVMIIISELSMKSTYTSVNRFINVFFKGNRLMYVGILLIFITMFTSFFFV